MSSTQDQNALPTGAMIQEFRVEGVLGVGSFGIVYRAKNIYFDQIVAIKEFLPKQLAHRADGSTVVPSSADNEEIYRWGLKKFVNEAKLLWELSQPEPHRNIIRVSRFHEANGTAYMVMDHEEGEPLSDLLRREGRLGQPELTRILYPLLDGLQRVHAKQVFHRDIKPPNVLVRPDGSPVLIDFGAARWEAANDGSSLVSILTPEYAAPEQSYAGGEIGAWTDIYALAATAYRAITGEAPAPASERVLTGYFRSALEAETSGPYDGQFLAAVDSALALLPQDRPVSVDVWRKRLRGQHIEGDADPTIIMEARPRQDMEAQPSHGADAASAAQRTSDAAAETVVGPISEQPADTVLDVPGLAEGGGSPAAAAPTRIAGTRATSPGASPPADKSSGPRGRTALVASVVVLALAGAGGVWYTLRPPQEQPPADVAEPTPRDAPIEPVPTVNELVEQLRQKSPEPAPSNGTPDTPTESVSGPSRVAESQDRGDSTPAETVPSPASAAQPAGSTETPSSSAPSHAEIVASLTPNEGAARDEPAESSLPATGPRPLPPASVAAAPEITPPLAPTPLDREQVLRELRAVIEGFNCQAVRTSWRGDDNETLALSGFVGGPDDLSALRSQLDPLAARGLAADFEALKPIGAPFCRPLALLANRAAIGSGQFARPQLELNKATGIYTDGETLQVTMTAPADGYLYLSYISPDGNVYHLLPSEEYPRHALALGEQVVVGSNGEYEISEPHGENLLVAIAVSQPLFAQPRPFEESVREFEAALAPALDRQSGGSLASSYAFVITRNK